MKPIAKSKNKVLATILTMTVYLLMLKFITLGFIVIYLLLIAGMSCYIYYKNKVVKIQKHGFFAAWGWLWGWLLLVFYSGNFVYINFGDPFVSVLEIKGYSTIRGSSEVTFVFNGVSDITYVKRPKFTSKTEKEEFFNSHLLELTLVKGIGCYFIKDKKFIKKD